MSDKQSSVVDSRHVGGPPVAGPSGSANGDLFSQVQKAVDQAYEQGKNTSLCAAVEAAQLVEEEPFSCMVELVDKYMNCNQDIPQDKIDLAAEAFIETTGLQTTNLDRVTGEINAINQDIVHLNAFYTFVPVLIFVIILIWVMVGFGIMNWALGLFFTVLAVVVLWSFNIAYRIHARNLLQQSAANLNNLAIEADNNFKDSLAYWPQGMFAVACAVTCEEGTECWTCNGTSPCPPASTRRIPRPRYTEKEPEKIVPSTLRSTRRRRRNNDRQ